MKNAGKILRYQLRDVIRGRWILVYTLIFLLTTDVLFRFGGSGERVVLSIMNVLLLIEPLVSIIFVTMYLYHSREFIVMLLAQPVDRTSLFLGLYGGMAIPLAGGYVVGVGLPFMWHAGGGVGSALVVLLLTGVMLTVTVHEDQCFTFSLSDSAFYSSAVAHIVGMIQYRGSGCFSGFSCPID